MSSDDIKILLTYLSDVELFLKTDHYFTSFQGTNFDRDFAKKKLIKETEKVQIILKNIREVGSQSHKIR